MLPGIDLRLQNVVKAMREVVIPAIPADQRLAHDQAMLVIGHIQIFAEQWREAARYEAGSLRHLAGLAERLLGSEDVEIGDDLRRLFDDVLARVAAVSPSDLTRTEALIGELGKLVDTVILTAGRPGTLPPVLLDAVLAYGDVQAQRERVWFAGTKLDPDVNGLESMAAMLSGE